MGKKRIEVGQLWLGRSECFEGLYFRFLIVGVSEVKTFEEEEGRVIGPARMSRRFIALKHGTSVSSGQCYVFDEYGEEVDDVGETCFYLTRRSDVRPRNVWPVADDIDGPSIMKAIGDCDG